MDGGFCSATAGHAQALDPNSARSMSPILARLRREGLFGYGTESALIVPMMIGDHIVGTISFYSRNRHWFDEDKQHLAVEFGGLAALAIDRARTHLALSEQATLDGLTGILNHRSLLERLDHQIAITDRNDDVFSLLMIDLNDFKIINDTYGHLAATSDP